MADHKEYEIRKHRLNTDPLYKDFKEGYWRSPDGKKCIYVCASYEASAINIGWTGKAHTSIPPIMWTYFFSDWEYLGSEKPSDFGGVAWDGSLELIHKQKCSG